VNGMPDAPSERSGASSCSGGSTEIPMTQPLVPGICPCGRPAGDDGLCDEHAGAIAFKVPLGPSGEALPAVWWHWPHAQPCPEGESWIITPSRGSRGLWACRHRRHAGEMSGGHDLPSEATG
jgi:hypothetical protein